MEAARARKCGAKARQNNHQPCRNPAMKNGRCRMHGGKSTGAKTIEGKQKQAQANMKHGRYTNEAIRERKQFRQILEELREEQKELAP